MSNILEQILATKRQEVAHRRTLVPERQLLDHISGAHTPLGFVDALYQRADQQKPGVIAEIKKASPSKRRYTERLRPCCYCNQSWAANATCLSIPTMSSISKDTTTTSVMYAKPLPCHYCVKTSPLMPIKSMRPELWARIAYCSSSVRDPGQLQDLYARAITGLRRSNRSTRC